MVQPWKTLCQLPKLSDIHLTYDPSTCFSKRNKIIDPQYTCIEMCTEALLIIVKIENNLNANQ